MQILGILALQHPCLVALQMIQAIPCDRLECFTRLHFRLESNGLRFDWGGFGVDSEPIATLGFACAFQSERNGVQYIQRELVPKGIRLTRLARGLPVGGDIEYADTVTLMRAVA